MSWVVVLVDLVVGYLGAAVAGWIELGFVAGFSLGFKALSGLLFYARGNPS